MTNREKKGTSGQHSSYTHSFLEVNAPPSHPTPPNHMILVRTDNHSIQAGPIWTLSMFSLGGGGWVKFIYLFLREREYTRGGGAERERETQNPKQAPGTELSAKSPTWGSNP